MMADEVAFLLSTTEAVVAEILAEGKDPGMGVRPQARVAMEFTL